MANRPQTGKIMLPTTYDEMLGGASGSGPTELAASKLHPYPGHPFKLYTGERLEKMVESIREHGILEPVIVWLKHGDNQNTDTYIILSGHNRVNAAKLAGLEKIPVRVMANLTKGKAALIVTETNLHQRSFGDLPHSERAVALHAHYEAIKDNETSAKFVAEIEALCGVPSGNGRSIEKTCEEFGASQGTVARYLRIYELLPELKEQMDEGKIPIRAGVELSWITPEAQHAVSEILNAKKRNITEYEARCLREQADALDETSIRAILCAGAAEQDKPYGLTVRRSVIEQYFPEKTKKKTIADTVEKALAMYFTQNIAETI